MKITVLQYDITFFLLHCDSPSILYLPNCFRGMCKWPATQAKWCSKFIALVSLSFLQIIMVHWTPSRVMKRSSMDNKPSHHNSCNSNPSKHPFDTISWCAMHSPWAPRTRVVVDPEMSPFRSFPLGAQICAFCCWSWIPIDPLATSNWATPVRSCIEYGPVCWSH